MAYLGALEITSSQLCGGGRPRCSEDFVQLVAIRMNFELRVLLDEYTYIFFVEDV